MTIYISDYGGGTLLVRMRVTGEGIVGDMAEVVGPGGSTFGLTYDEVRALGYGAHDMDLTTSRGGKKTSKNITR